MVAEDLDKVVDGSVSITDAQQAFRRQAREDRKMEKKVDYAAQVATRRREDREKRQKANEEYKLKKREQRNKEKEAKAEALDMSDVMKMMRITCP